MELTKQNICLYIKDEDHLEEMREFLGRKAEIVNKTHFYISDPFYNHLQLWKDGQWMLDDDQRLTEVTTEQFKKLWK